MTVDGSFVLHGPDLIAATVQCAVAALCQTQISGLGLAAGSALMIALPGSCGASPTAGIWSGLTNPQTASGDGFDTFVFGTTVSATSDLVWDLCWGHAPGQTGHPVKIGTLQLSGPAVSTSSIEVELEVHNVEYNVLLADPAKMDAFKLAVQMAIAQEAGSDVTYADVELVVAPGSVLVTATITVPTADDAAAILAVLQLSSTLGSTIATAVSSDLTLAVAFTGLVTANIVGEASLGVAGTAASCSLGQPCTVEIPGTQLDPISALLFRDPSDACNDLEATVNLATWVGIDSPQNPAEGLNSTFVFGTAYSGDVGGGYIMCWTPNEPDPFNAAAFVAEVGTFAMVGPAPPAEAFVCFVMDACSIQLLGHGFEAESWLDFRDAADADCRQSGTLGTFLGITNPKEASASTPDIFTLGFPFISGGDLGVTYSLCWGATDGDREVLAGQLVFLGPEPEPSSYCVLGEPCEVQLVGKGLIGSDGTVSSAFLAQGKGKCGTLSAAAVAWLGVTSPVDVAQVSGAPPAEAIYIYTIMSVCLYVCM